MPLVNKRVKEFGSIVIKQKFNNDLTVYIC